jgi:hypothetical protein
VKGRDAAPSYDAKRHARAYWQHAMALYREKHIDNATRMILRAAQFPPNGRLANFAAKAFWAVVRLRRRRLAKAPALVQPAA